MPESIRMRTVTPPLTSVEGSDKAYVSRVTGDTQTEVPMRSNQLKVDEVISLPIEDHDGCCFIAL